MINYSLMTNMRVPTEHEVATQEVQQTQIQALRDALDEDRKEIVAKLEELYRRSDETISKPLDPIPMLPPDAKIEEVIEAVNKLVYYVNSRMTDDS